MPRSSVAPDFHMLHLEDFQRLAEQYRDALSYSVREFDINGKMFHFNARPHLMGVVNLSPDSWYRESVCFHSDQAFQRGRRLTLEGADLIDVGAESSVLSADHVDEDQQIERLIPVIRKLVAADILVSAETYQLAVAKACLQAGARVLNLTGTTKTNDIFRMVSEHGAAVILCYVEGENVRSVSDLSFQEDLIPKMKDYFSKKIDEAVSLGVTRIMIDPGLGFYYRNLQDSVSRVRYQMRIFLHTFRLRELGWPICHALPHAFEYFGEEVRSAEPFFAFLALLGKTSILRTHEISKVQAVIKTMDVWKSL